MSFGKLFASLYEGSLRGKTHEIVVFTNMIAKCDAEGVVDRHFLAIAQDVGLTVEEARRAIQNLEAPDPESRTPDAGGARLTRLDDHREWGWQIVNYVKYREIRNEEDRREKNRAYQKASRSRRNPDGQQPSGDVSTRQHLSAPVSTCQDSVLTKPDGQHLSGPVSTRQHASAMSAKAEAEAEASQMKSERAGAREADANEWPERPKGEVVNPSPAAEAAKAREYGCKWPTEEEVSLYLAKVGIPETFYRNWIREMEDYVILRADDPQKRMLDSGGRPVSNWRSYLLGFWRRHQGQRGSAQRPGGQNRSTGRPERQEDPLEGCREAVLHPDALPHWDADKELPADEWVHFKGCFQATITNRELYRRLYRAKQSRGEDTTEIFKELQDECRREWRGSFNKYWSQFISRDVTQ